MNYLEMLDIHYSVRSFFAPYLTLIDQTIQFNYESENEHAGPNFHRIPITESYWRAGEPALASQLIISSSAMDAIVWLNQNYARFRNLDDLLFISIGAVPFPIRFTPQKKIQFIFSKDPTGILCDLKLASYIRNKPLKITNNESHYEIRFENKTYRLNNLSLNALEKASGYNFRIRTNKPKNANTFYEELRNRHYP